MAHTSSLTSLSARARVAALALTLVGLNGCARPSSESIQAFASATGGLLTSANAAADFNAAMNQKVHVAEKAQAYAAKGAVDVSPNPDKLLGGHGVALWRSVTGFLGAVTAYAKALAAANDPALVTGASGAVATLGGAVGGVATATGAPASVTPQITAVANIASHIVQIGLELHAARQLRSAMEDVQPLLEQAQAPLTRIVTAIRTDTGKLLRDYDSLISIRLDLARTPPPDEPAATAEPGRADPATGNGPPVLAKGEEFQRRYELYVALVSERDALLVQHEALARLPAAIAAMANAHAEIIASLDKPQARTAALLAFVQQVGAIATEIGKLQALQDAKR
ncbi:hypothetical protein MWN33_10315 [Starkeya koreensis]|uniref:Lipoprotein n=1 Tax=Ancylobacter koreensis TaxID=266121 RepID=A0ABT0DMC0_9HYPH|nr:hypothetical protein [Ancylobacter koreensis]MCK0208423.1 hypothetical protein [Ancylobacter koreensis]